MKYDEKQRRKKLKRKIWVAAAGLAMLGCLTVLTWDSGWLIHHTSPNATVIWRWYGEKESGGWRIAEDSPGTSIAFRAYILVIDEGQITIGASKRDDDVMLPTLPGNQIGVAENPPGWLWEDARMWKIARRNLDEPPWKTVRFAGFEFTNGSHRVSKPSFTLTLHRLTFPIWLLAIAPALLMLWWCLQLRRVSRNESAFPVIIKESPDKS